jgi:hypothetical protein
VTIFCFNAPKAWKRLGGRFNLSLMPGEERAPKDWNSIPRGSEGPPAAFELLRRMVEAGGSSDRDGFAETADRSRDLEFCSSIGGLVNA